MQVLGLVTAQAAGHVALFATVLSILQQHNQPDKNKHSLSARQEFADTYIINNQSIYYFFNLRNAFW